MLFSFHSSSNSNTYPTLVSKPLGSSSNPSYPICVPASICFPVQRPNIDSAKVKSLSASPIWSAAFNCCVPKSIRARSCASFWRSFRCPKSTQSRKCERCSRTVDWWTKCSDAIWLNSSTTNCNLNSSIVLSNLRPYQILNS